MARQVFFALACVPLLGGCATGPAGWLADALSPWPTFGSSQALLASNRLLAPETGLTARRVADGAETMPPGDKALVAEDTDPWPAAPPPQNTLADFERSLHDGSPLPPPPGTALKGSSP